MRSLISDLLGYATASNKEPEPTTLSLDTVVQRALTLRDAPGGAGVPTVVAEELGNVWADPMLLLQLLDNLIGNAAKYVAPGTVPHIVVSSDRHADGYVEVAVADNGIGIPAAERELVFETFHRAHTTGFNGTGLGLAICKKIVEAHGGRIAAEANPAGQGSVFRFTLPVAPGEGPRLAPGRHRVPVA
jgi:signal transduction histidine kinase